MLFLAVGSESPARNPIRTIFFKVYTNAVGTRLDSLPDKVGHCGVCHFDFNGGGARNPYGLAIQNYTGGLSSATYSNAIVAAGLLDSDSDGFTSQNEVTNRVYPNAPTFPGVSAANLGDVLNIATALISSNLTPAMTADTTPPTVSVTVPNGGQVFTANRATNITWTASDAAGPVSAIHLYESRDQGVTFTPIALGLSNSGSYAWTPANRPSTTALIRAVAVDGAANTSNDTSDAAFSIVSPPGGRVPTTLRDFDMPGTQPFEGGPELLPPAECAACHGNYDAAVEPYANWQGSMMAHASLDPLFEANMAIANQDAPDSGDLCLRCHLPRGWMAGRSVPTDGTRMQDADLMGVACDLCHSMVDPVYRPGISAPSDTNVLNALSFKGTNYGNGMYVVDPSSVHYGPYSNAPAPHLAAVSAFIRSAAFCGTCHDVSNPAFTRDGNGIYQPNALDARATNFSAHVLGPVERTYSEWLHSSYNTTGGVYAPAFAGTKPDGRVSTCQDCHMRDVQGYGANPALNTGLVSRVDLPLHDMTGGSTWVPRLLTNLHPDKVDAGALEAGIQRATALLQKAASLGVEGVGGQLRVSVTNECGHKLPTGYPEGRRVWVNVRFYDGADTLVGESGAYDLDTGVLTHDAEAKVYEVHPGIDTNISGLVGLAAGPSLHFVLNNRIYSDNRIPPRGFSNAAFAAFGGAPIAHAYADGQYWDDTYYVIPTGACRAEVRLYYQSTSKEFIEFLRDENTTNSKGQEMYDLWNNNGKCPPTLMAEADWVAPPPGFAGAQSVTAGVESATIAWAAADSVAPVAYRVYVAATSGAQQFAAPFLSTSGLSAVIAPLDPGQTSAVTYYVVVRASTLCGMGESNLAELAVQPLLDAAKDQDGDGINNAYETTYALNPFDPSDAHTDPDEDGFTTWEEFIAMTDPHAPTVYFEALGMEFGGVNFSSAVGRLYGLEVGSLTSGVWALSGSNRPGTGGMMQLPVTNEDLFLIYRLRVTLPPDEP